MAGEGNQEAIQPRVTTGAGISAAAILSVVGYLVAFLYEVGYCRAYDIPPGLINLNLQSVFIAIGGILASGLIFFNVGASVFPRVFFAVRRYPDYMLPRMFAAGGLTFLFSFHVKPWILWIISFLLIRSWIARAPQAEADVQTWHLYPLLLEIQFGRRVVGLIIGLFYMLSIPLYFGSVEAHSPRFMWFSSTPERFTILRVYGDTIVTMPQKRTNTGYAVEEPKHWWNLTTYTLAPGLKFFKVADNSTPPFTETAGGRFPVDWARPAGEPDWVVSVGRIVFFWFY